jgi:effector-binding domain-containing protein
MSMTAVQVARVSSIPLAVVRRQTRASELAVVVPEGCGLVWSFVRAHQLSAGRNVAVYWDGTIRLDVGVELSGHLPEGGDIVRSATPAGLVASVVHHGPYSQLGTAHRTIQEWCSANGYELAGPNWEVYGHWQDAWNADPSQIRADVFYQLTSGGSSIG